MTMVCRCQTSASSASQCGVNVRDSPGRPRLQVSIAASWSGQAWLLCFSSIQIAMLDHLTPAVQVSLISHLRNVSIPVFFSREF